MNLDSGKYFVCSKCCATYLVEEAEGGSSICKFCGSAMKMEDRVVKGYDGVASNFRIDKKRTMTKRNSFELRVYSGTDKRVVIPDFVTDIGMMAFYDNGYVEEIVLPEGLESISYGSFAQCKNLRKINMPSTVTYLAESAFSGCISLSCVELPENMYIKVHPTTFFECPKLEVEWRNQGKCPYCGFKLKKGIFKKTCERCGIIFK